MTGHINERVIVQGCTRYPCKCEVCLNCTDKRSHPIIPSDEGGGDRPVQIYHNTTRAEARRKYLSRYPESKKIQIAFA